MRTGKIDDLKGNEINLLCFIDKVFISVKSLHIYLGISQTLTRSWIDLNIDFKKTLTLKNSHWIDVDFFKNEEDFDVPFSNELSFFYFSRLPSGIKMNNRLVLQYEYLKTKVNCNDYLMETIKANCKFDIAKRIAVTISLFAFLNSIKVITTKEKFYLYIRFFYEKLEHIPSFKTFSYTAFQNKLKAFKDIGTRAFIHNNKNNKNAAILFTEKERSLINKLFKNGFKLSFRKITIELNTYRILSRGAKPVSVQTVINFIKNKGQFREMYFQRYGSEAISDFLPHPRREQPESPGATYQIDGSRFNILYKDNDGNIGFKCIIVMLDVFSKKIVAYTTSVSETFQAYRTTIESAILATGFLSQEIISDNLASLNSREGTDFKHKLKRIGVELKPHALKNPQAKGQIENWFSLFGMLYLKKVSGFLGDGVMSKSKDGKPTHELKMKYRSLKNIMTEKQLDEKLHEQINLYNNTYSFKSSFPSALFRDTNPIHAVKFDEDLKKYLLLSETYRKFTSSIIRLQINKKTYEYIIYGDNIDFIDRFLQKYVLIRYDKNNLDKIYVYQDNNSLNYEISVNLHNRFRLSGPEQTDKDIRAIKILGARKKHLETQLKKTSTSQKTFGMQYQHTLVLF